MKIIAIKTNDGYLISDNIENKPYFSSKLSNLFFDNIKFENTFKSDWYKIKNKPTEIQREVIRPPINQRWELKSEFDNGTFKKIWLHSDTFDENSDYKQEFINIKGLYEYKEDKQSTVLENVNFEWEEILQIEVFKEPNGFSYKAAGQWDSEKYSDITEKNLKYDILTQVLTPSVLLHTRPCKLSSKETYDIIRKYIKENINPKVAEIKSDYDFCFAVNKKIPLAKPYTYQINVNNSIFNKRKRKPKYETKLVDKKSIQIFEMTYYGYGNNKNGYEKYTPIEPFEAENQEALIEYIDKYLEELITVINEPVCECDKCEGRGILFNNVVK